MSAVPTPIQEAAAAGDDPGQAHFDATLLACGEAVARLINASPRTPTAEQFRDLIRDTMRAGFESDQAVALDDELGRSDDPNDPTNFKAVKIEFGRTNTDFAEDNLPPVRLAFKFLENDRAGAVEAVRRMMTDGREDLVEKMADGWETVGDRLKAIVGALEAALARLEIARRRIEEDRP